MTPSNDQDRKITEESVEGDEKSAIKEVEEVIEKDDDPLFCTPFLLERVMITALIIFMSILTRDGLARNNSPHFVYSLASLTNRDHVK